eukprot:g1654.t1
MKLIERGNSSSLANFIFRIDPRDPIESSDCAPISRRYVQKRKDLRREWINRDKLGKYIVELDDGIPVKYTGLARYFANERLQSGVRIVEALRDYFCGRFTTPHDKQSLLYLSKVFAESFMTANPEMFRGSVRTAEVITFSVIMLSIEAHGQKGGRLRNRFTSLSEFIDIIESCCPPSTLSEDLKEMYWDVLRRPVHLKTSYRHNDFDMKGSNTSNARDDNRAGNADHYDDGKCGDKVESPIIARAKGRDEIQSVLRSTARTPPKMTSITKSNDSNLFLLKTLVYYASRKNPLYAGKVTDEVIAARHFERISKISSYARKTRESGTLESRSMPVKTSKYGILSDPKQTLRIVVVGKQKCGKTDLISRYLNLPPPDEYEPTLQDLYTTEWVHSKMIVRLEVVEIGGTFKKLDVLSTGDCFILAFDLTDGSSFEKMLDFRVAIETYVPRGRAVSLVIVGCKADLPGGSEICRQRASGVAKHAGCLFIECSARNEKDINAPFDYLVRNYLRDTEK